MGGRVPASRPRSVVIIVVGCVVWAGSVSWIRRAARRCGLPAIRHRARGARSGCALEVLVDGGEALPCIAEALAGARAHVHIAGWYLTPGFGLRRDDQASGLREPTVDRAVIAHVVAKVDHQRDVERRQPDRIDPERPGRAGQVIQLRADVRQQFTDAVPVAVRTTVRVDLVDHRLPPPRPTRRCCSARHLPDDWWPSAREPRSCDSHVTALVLEQMTLAWQRRAARLLLHRAVDPAVRGVDPPRRGSQASCLPGPPWRSTVDHQLGE
jgi:hypothetical protein